jgi:GNAT superfamily N-acetyltransferase
VDQSSSEHLRLLKAEDVSAAFQMSAQANWEQTEEDWRMLLDLSPEGCLAMELDGRLVATTTLLVYERRLAWVGMVLTRPEYQRRGLARGLLARALELADRRGIETVKLDATEQGLPLYEKFGFRFEEEVERWLRPGEGVARLSASQPQTEKPWRDSDLQAFGADRSRLLDRLAQRNPPVSLSRSYLFARPGRRTAYLGPCVCDNPAAARRLIEPHVRNTGSSGRCSGWSWDLLPRNREAVAVARDLGFTPQRRLVRMVRGKDLRAREDAVYAIAGFELG